MKSIMYLIRHQLLLKQKLNNMDKKQAIAAVEKYLADMATRKGTNVVMEESVGVPVEWAHVCPYGLDYDDMETLKDWGII